MPLNDLPVYQMEYGEVGTFGKNVVSIVKENAPGGECDLQALNQRLENRVRTLEEKSGVSHIDEKDAAVNEADQKRDDTINKITRHLRGCLDNLEPGMVSSANYLLDVFKRQGTNIANLSLENETHALNVVLNEIRKEEYRIHLAVTKTESIFNQLDSENKNFETVYNKRNTLNAVSTDPVLSIYVNDVRKELSRIFNYLAVIEVLRADKLKPVIDRINAEISVLAPKVYSRRTRSEKKKESPVQESTR